MRFQKIFGEAMRKSKPIWRGRRYKLPLKGRIEYRIGRKWYLGSHLKELLSYYRDDIYSTKFIPRMPFRDFNLRRILKGKNPVVRRTRW